MPLARIRLNHVVTTVILTRKQCNYNGLQEHCNVNVERVCEPRFGTARGGAENVVEAVNTLSLGHVS